MSAAHYDVVIVGGGIHGVGVAQAAAAAGHSVLLLEQMELASATSSRSSKLIHGGLRYLESLQIGLVRECLRERRILLAIAPDLVHLRDFYIPIYRSTRRRPWQITVGLGLYHGLGGRPGNSLDANRHRSIVVPKSRWSELDGLKTEDLQMVFVYQDAQTDDRALTQAVMNSALSLGAELALPARFVSAVIDSDVVRVRYEQNHQTHECQARVLVNAAGPWVNEVINLIQPKMQTLAIDLVQGTHIVVHGETKNGIYYLENPEDKRAIFVMPWKNKTLVGTTERVVQGPPLLGVSAMPTNDEQQYLLRVLTKYFSRYQSSDLIEAWAGLRVLPAGRGAVFRRSRETMFTFNRHSKPQVVNLYGGKLTSYRATAEKLLKHVEQSLPSERPRADTCKLRLDPA